MLGGGLPALGFVLGLVVVASLVARRRLARGPLRTMTLIGLWLRVAGAMVYLLVIGERYGGGDYVGYYHLGLEYARRWEMGGPSPIAGLFAGGLGSSWWGTAFTARLAGLVLSLLGPSLPGAFIVFALIGFVGIFALALAFMRAFPDAEWKRYLALVMLFPSLWFWPAALGKDAVVLCGVGLATLGFVGRGDRMRPVLMALGVAIVFVIRPQVAATLGFALVVGQWVGTMRRWSFFNLVQAVAILALGAWLVALSSGALGVKLFNREEVTDYLSGRGAASSIGGSAIEGGGSVSPWLAPVNTLFRPFPWEANGATALLASAEVLVLWGLVWGRRRAAVEFFRAHSHHRVLWMAVVFVALYSTALGMSLGNVGIIARQRVHILPFLFFFVAGGAHRYALGWWPHYAYGQPYAAGRAGRAAQAARSVSRTGTNRAG